MGHSHYHVNNFDAGEISTSWAGTKNTFLKMSLRNARVSLEYLYENVTNDTPDLRKLSCMPEPTFYRNFLKNTQYWTKERKPGSGRPSSSDFRRQEINMPKSPSKPSFFEH